MKHAWLILAHNEFEVLQQLVSMLDAPENDFYIHFDKKVKRLPSIYVTHGRLEIVKERIDARWGTVSLIKAELILFSAAREKGPYAYYHILSGTTLPLKSMAEMACFFSTLNGESVLTGLKKDTPYQEILKVHRYNFFLRNYNNKIKLYRLSSQFFWKAAIAVQRILGVQINSRKIFYKASQWLSLTNEAVEWILSRKTEILKTYRWSFCGDEFFVPSELMDSPLRDKVYNYDKYLMHTIGRANASSYRLAEWDGLSKSGYLFARKFTR